MRKSLCILLCFLVSVTIYAQPAIQPTGPISLCQGNNQLLTITGANGSPSYKWEISTDGGTTWSIVSGAATSSLSVSTTGKYRAIVTGTSTDTTAAVDVTVNANPTASFSFSPDNQCSNVPVSFTNTSTGTGLTYQWNFGDPNSGSNNTSNSQNPNHQFVGAPGNNNQTFTVGLTATNAFGCTAITTQPVTTKQIPDASIMDYTDNTPFINCGGGSNFNLLIDNVSTTVSTNTNYKIVWGDGTSDYNSSTLPSTGTSHLYTSLGYFTLTLSVTGQNGCIATKDYTIYNGSNPQVPFSNPGASIGQCVPFTYTIPTLPTNNPPGTIYIISKNDGTPDETLTGPLPPFYSHTFTNTSCGATGGNTPNTFKIKIRAQNPCGFSDLTIEPITTSVKPKAKFTISPDSVACVNTTLTFTNTSLAGVTVDNFGTCNNTTPFNWTVSPSTGWNIVNGKLGDANPTNNNSTWGSTNLGLSFSAAGQYTITLIARSSCGNDTISRVVCIQAPPSPSFTTPTSNGCSPFTASFTNTSTGLNQCGPKTIVWNVTKINSTCPKDSANDFVFTAGTGASSLDPVIRFNNQGTYEVSLSITNKCGTFTSSKRTIVVKRKPTISLSAPASICSGQHVTPTATTNDCGSSITSYSWSLPGSSNPTSTNVNPGTITYSAPGTYQISVTITNECGTVTATQQIVVNANPSLTVPANVITCPGNAVGPLSFASTSTGTASFSWTNSNTNIGLLQSNGNSNPIPVFTAANSTTSAITSTIAVTATNAGCSTQSSFTITVNPSPTVTQPANQTLCNGSNTNPINFSGTGTTYSWTNNNTSIGLAASGTGNIPSFAAVNTGNTPVTATIVVTPKTNDGVACSGAAKTFTITVSPSPVITATATNPTSCGTATGKIVISGLTTGATYTINYSKNGTPVSPTTQTAAAGGTVTISGLTAGTYSNITVTLNGCPSNAVGPFTLSDPNPPATPTASSNSPLCSGQTLNLSVTSPVAGVSYQWTGPNGFSSPTANATRPNVTVADAGIYSVTATLAGCSSPAGTVNVVVNQTPVAPTVTNNGPVCSGNTINLNATTPTNGVTWSWTGPNGFTGNVANPSIPNAASTHAGTYSVTATLGACTSAAGTTTVAVKPTPAITAVSSNPTNCNSATGTITISGLANNTAYTYNYTRNGVPQSGSGTSTASGTLVIGGLSSGTYNNLTVTLNGCVSNAVGPFTLSDPNPPATPTATANGPVCAGNTLTLGTTAVSGATYTWTGPNSFTSNLQNPAIPNATTAATGTYTLTVTVNGCTSAAATVNAVVNATPVVATASSNSPVCTGNNLNLNATTSFAGALTWAWTGPNGFSSTQQNPVIPNVTTAEAGSYTVTATATTGSCASAPKTVTVVVNPTPNITAATANNPVNCNTATGSIELSGLTAGANYTVSFTKNGTAVAPQSITANASGVVTINNLASGLYDNIRVTLAGCTSNVVGPYTLVDPNPPATPVATSNGPVCSGNTLNLNASTTTAGAVSFAWTGPNGFTSNLPSPSINNVSMAANGTYSVTATLNGCTSAAGTVTVVINETPAAPTVSSNSPVCTGNTLNLGSTSSFTGAVTYAWTGPNGFTSSLPNPSIPNATTAASGNYSLVITATTGNCPSAAGTTSVTVNPTPVITGSSHTNPTNCNSATGTITLNGLTAGAGYTVHYTQNGTPKTATITANGSGDLIIPNLPAGVYTNVSVTHTGCPSNVVGPFTLTDPNPPAAPVATSNGPVCSGNTLQLSATSTSTGTLTYAWSGPNGFTSTDANPTISNVSVAASGTYSVTVTLNGCTSAAATVNVVINQTPATPVVTSNSPVCTGDTLFLSSSTSFTGAVTWAWTGPNGFTSTEQNPFIANTTVGMAGTYSVIATATTGSCPSASGSAAIVINPTPAIANATAQNPTNCNTATGSISLEGLTANTSYTVHYLKNGAAQTATLTANAGGVLVINNLTAGVYSGISVTLTGCSSNVVGPFTLVDPNPPATPVAGSNGPICSGNTLSLSASTTTSGNLTWAWTGPNGFTSSLQNPSIPAATTADAGTYSVTVTLNNCVSPAGTVNVVVNQTPAAPVVNSNGPICAGSTLNLTASTSFTGTVTWAWTGPNGFTSNDQNPAISNATTAATGTYTVTATAAQGGCPSPAASVPVVVHPELVNTIDTASQTICFSQPVTVNGSVATGGNGTYTYQWEQSTDNITWTPIAGQTGVSITLTPSSSIYLRRKVSSSPCQSFSLSAYITVQPPVSNNTVQQDQAICINTAAATLVGSVPTGANGIYQYRWEQSTDNGLTWTTIAGANAKDYAPGVLTQTTRFRRVVTTNLCVGPQSSTSNAAIITVNPDAKALFLPTDTLNCPPFTITSSTVNLQTYPALNSQYQWYANGVLIGSGTNFPGYTIANEDDSVTIMLKAISLYGCKNDSISRKFYTYKLPHPAFDVSDTVGCGPLTVQFQNTTPNRSLFTYFWDFGNGQTSTQAQPSAIVFQPNPTYGDTVYTVKLKVFSVCDTVTVSKEIRVKSKPKALFTPTRTSGCSPMTVTFKNTSKGHNVTYFWDFGDGTTLSTATPDTVQHTFVTGVVDTFYVKLKATNECGTDSLTYSIIVAPNSIKLNLAVNGTDRFGCEPHVASFINNSQGASVFHWNFGDGAITTTTKNLDTVRHTYLSPGTYLVTLRAINNCSDTATTETIVVFPKPRASFTANKFTICVGDTLRLINQSDSATAYLWKFGDGLTSTLANPTHVYNLPGNYTVTLVTYRDNQSGNVCIDSTQHPVQVTPTQTGLFTVSDSVGQCAPFTVTLVNRNTPSVTTVWDLGDGNTATGDSIVHTYQTAGDYVVTLTTKVPGGCTYVTTKTITVNGPKGVLQYTGGNVCHPSAVRFQAVSTGATAYVWDFGDGTILNTTQQTVFHTYSNAGFYVPKVTLQNGTCNLVLQGIDTIKVDKVDGGFTFAKSEVCGNTTLTFTDTSHVFSGIQSIHWNFGDNTTGSGAAPSHTYAATGRYTVQMIVTAKSGCTDTVTRQIDVLVKSIPVVSINAVDTGCTRRTIAFNAVVQTVDAINLIQWNLSNGAAGTGAVFNHTFTQPGTYDLQLIVGTVNGCYDTAYHTVVINPSPVVTASGPQDLCRGNSVQLNAIGAATWQWLPLSGLSCYDCPNPVASPTVTTPYVVRGTNSFGCFDEANIVITVIQPLQMNVSPDDSICIGQSTNLLASGASAYSWSPANGLNNTTISNPTASPTVTTTYRVVGYDGYNCFTDTAFVTVGVGQYPTVDLGPDVTLATGTLHPLTSTITNGPIRDWVWSPATNLNCATCPRPIAEVKKDITYTVVVTTPYGCSATDTISIKTFCKDGQVFIPNAFTPDGDGLNDRLTVRASGIVSVKYFRIFNRWGDLIFERANFRPNDPAYGWDGKVRGVLSGPEVFVYTCEVLCENGTSYTYKGNTSIIK